MRKSEGKARKLWKKKMKIENFCLLTGCLISVCLRFCIGTGTSVRSLVMSLCWQREELQRHHRKQTLEGCLLEGHRGLPVALANTCWAGHWAQACSCKEAGDRSLLEKSVPHTSSTSLPFAFKCLTEEGLAPSWRRSEWRQLCGQMGRESPHNYLE